MTKFSTISLYSTKHRDFNSVFSHIQENPPTLFSQCGRCALSNNRARFHSHQGRFLQVVICSAILESVRFWSAMLWLKVLNQTPIPCKGWNIFSFFPYCSRNTQWLTTENVRLFKTVKKVYKLCDKCCPYLLYVLDITQLNSALSGPRSALLNAIPDSAHHWLIPWMSETIPNFIPSCDSVLSGTALTLSRTTGRIFKSWKIVYHLNK